jgi:hypothetical protein
VPGNFASGKYAHGFCDVCGFRVKLSELKNTIVNEKRTGIKACPTCYDKDHPQLRVGRIKVEDPQALRDPRPDPALEASRELP